MYITARDILVMMKIAARYLVRLENAEHLPVARYSDTRSSFVGMLLPLGCTVNSTRISSVAIEVDFLSSSAADAGKGLRRLEKEGKVLSVTDLMLAAEPGDVRSVMAEARRLFNQERFWEVHETVEGAWRRATGEEKGVQQSIILYAAALVHYQKNEINTTLRMLKRAIDKMKWEKSRYHGFDLERMRMEAELMRESGMVHIFRL